MNYSDKNGRDVVIECLKTDMFCKQYFDAMKSAWEIAKKAYLKIEVDFLKAFPEVVSAEPYFKCFEPFFKNGIEKVDWKLVEDKMQEKLKGHFIYDPSKFDEKIQEMFRKMEHYFVSVKDKETSRMLGFITFFVMKGYAKGDIKCSIFAVLPEEQNKGLGKLLINSIFEVEPEIKRIFLCTRVTNKNAVNAYKKWGFTEDNNPYRYPHQEMFKKEHWIFLEYVK